MPEPAEITRLLLEWSSGDDSALDQHLRTYLFTEAPVTEIEVEAEHGADAEPGPGPRPADGSLGIGGLKGRS